MSKNYSSFERELKESGKLIYTNVGVSMMPLIRENRDVMVIERLKEPPRKRQIVLFRRDGMEGRGRYVVHRILKIRKDGVCWIAGDHDMSGEAVRADQILGVLTSLVRDGKEFNFDGLLYRLYVRVWCAPYRLRFFLLRVTRGARAFFSAVRHKLFQK